MNRRDDKNRKASQASELPCLVDAMNWLALASMSIHISTNGVGIVANSLFVWLVVAKTPPAFRVYAVLLLNFAITDLVTCLAALFVMQRLAVFVHTMISIIPSGLVLGYLSQGPCKFFGPSVCYVGYSIMLHLYEHSLNSLAASFAYRLYVLSRYPPSRQKLTVFVLLLLAVSLVPMVTFC